MNYNYNNMQEHDAQSSVSISFPEKMSLEVLSLSDGKEAIVKSANFLYSEFYLNGGNIQYDQTGRAFNELDVGNALRSVGWFSISNFSANFIFNFSDVNCICKIYNAINGLIKTSSIFRLRRT